MNSTYFNLEEGEFYADIYEYDVSLNYKRDRIWLYPQTLGVTSESEGTTVNVLINDKDVRENYYVSVDIDKDAEMVPVIITVEYTDKTGARISSSYKLNIYQGKREVVQGSTVSGAMDSVKEYIDQVLSDIDMDASIVDMVLNAPFELPDRILNIATLMLPSFSSGGTGMNFISMLLGYSKDESDPDDGSLGGAGILDALDKEDVSSDGSSSSGGSFTGQLNLGNLSINNNGFVKPIKPADTVVVPDAGIQYPDNNIEDDENWLTDLMSDPLSLVLCIIILISIFVICLALFMRLLAVRAEKAKAKKD